VLYTEVSSYIWFEVGNKKANPSVEVLVLGDSQLLSGINASTISELANVPTEKILFMVRPSEQPEGMYDQYLKLQSDLPNLKKIYLNLSPISLSKNTVLDAHRELFYGFGSFHLHQLTDNDLRHAYFNSNYDLIWKLIIEVFPFFGLNQNFSSLFAIVNSGSSSLDGEVQNSNHVLSKMPTLSLLRSRREQNQFLIRHFQNNESWTWKAYGEERVLKVSDILPDGSALAFQKERQLSVRIIKRLVAKAKAEKVQVICLDLPFSPALEKDIEKHNIRNYLDKQKEELDFDQVINVASSHLNKEIYFTDFTHLNYKGRDVLRSFLLKSKD